MRKMTLLRIILPIILITIAALYFSCTSPTGPGGDVPGRRDYTWTVDTIKTSKNNQAQLYSIWGSSPTDLWLAGYAYTYKDNAWHYDGNKWKAIPIPSGGNVTTIWGFSKNDVWAGCTNGDIFHFNGTGWNKITTVIIDSLGPMLIENIWGSSPDDIYCVGYAGDTGDEYKGIIYHYDGVKWAIVTTEQIKTILLRFIKLSSNEMLLLGWAIQEKTDTYRFYTLNGQKIIEIARTGDVTSLSLLDNRPYTIIGKKIYNYENSLELWHDFTGTNYIGRLWGRAENDFFTVNNDGIGHFNGSDLITIFQSNHFYYVDAAIFSSDVFFIRNTLDNLNLIVNGKLK